MLLAFSFCPGVADAYFQRLQTNSDDYFVVSHSLLIFVLSSYLLISILFHDPMFYHVSTLGLVLWILLSQNPDFAAWSVCARGRGERDGDALRVRLRRAGGLVERFDTEFNTDFSGKSPNFRGLVLFCIEADFCTQIRIFQHFSRTTRFAILCTAPISKFEY